MPNPIASSPPITPASGSVATLLTLGGIGAAFGLASCCALPFLLTGLGLGTAWLTGIGLFALFHRTAFIVVALIGLTGIVIWSGSSVAAGGMDKDLHEALAYSLLALIGLHVGAVLLMSLLTGENLVRAMISGRKKNSLYPNVREARGPGLFAALLGAAAIVLAIIAIVMVDPTAFAPQQRHSHQLVVEAGPGSGPAAGQTGYRRIVQRALDMADWFTDRHRTPVR